MSNGRRRNRSTQTPANTPTSSTGADSAASSQPMSLALAPSRSTAVSGSAVPVTPEPKREMVCPAHSFRNSGCCQRLREPVCIMRRPVSVVWN